MSQMRLPNSAVCGIGNYNYGIAFVTCTNGETVCGGISLDGVAATESELASEAATAADKAFCEAMGDGGHNTALIGISDFSFWHGGYGGRVHRFGIGCMFAEVARQAITEVDGDEEEGDWEWTSEVPEELATRIRAAIAAADKASDAAIAEQVR